jgi:hypothetical protein
MYLVAATPANRARDSSGSATCPVAPAPIFGHRTALGLPRAPWLQLLPPEPAVAPGPPRALWPRLMSPGIGHRWDHHMPRGRSYGLWAIKVNKYLTAAQPSWSPSGRAHESSKALCNKDGACKTCGQVGCRPTPAQHRHAARSQWFATVQIGSTTLGSQLRQTCSYSATAT